MQDEPSYAQLCQDLRDEQDELDTLVVGIDRAEWARPTPAQGWDVRDQIGHLAVSEELAALALCDGSAFASDLEARLRDPAQAAEQHLVTVRSMTGPDVLERWRRARGRALQRLSGHDPVERIPWVVGPMSATSFVTARLMETWAHGHDIADALGRVLEPTPRLAHIARLGVVTRAFSYTNRGLALPADDVRVELDGADGQTWAWGGPSATDRITGSVLDFCLVVTQRRQVADTSLRVEGPAASEWMSIAQAFAGPPTAGPRGGEKSEH